MNGSKRTNFLTLLGKVLTFIFFGGVFWQLLFPISVALLTPEVLPFHKPLAEKMGGTGYLYFFLIGFGYTFALINVGFRIWRFRATDYKTTDFKNFKAKEFKDKIYSGWIWIGNLLLVGASLKLLFTPVYY